MFAGRFLRIAAVVVMSLSPCAEAATMVVTAVGFGEYPVPMLTDHGAGLTAENAFAGQILISINSNAYIAYCVDLFTPISYGTYNSTFGSPSAYPNGQRAAWMLSTYGPSVATNEDGAALQIAIWDVVHNGGDGFSAGTVQLAGTASVTLRSKAEAIIAASVAQSSLNATILYNSDLNGVPKQALMTSGVLVETPEPASAAFVMAGLTIGAGLLRRQVAK